MTKSCIVNCHVIPFLYTSRHSRIIESNPRMNSIGVKNKALSGFSQYIKHMYPAYKSLVTAKSSRVYSKIVEGFLAANDCSLSWGIELVTLFQDEVQGPYS
jgi:hypothetical protein